MTDRDLDALRDLAAASDPDDATRARLSRHLDQHIERQAHRPPTRARFRLPRIALGATLAAAAALALVFALAPTNEDTTRRYAFTGPDTAAARALVDAGEAAADARWQPLSDRSYFHVYSTSFQTPGARAAGFDTGPSTYEVWLRRDGSGRAILVSGGEYPERFMHIGYNKRTGEIMNIGGSTLPKGPRVSEARALRNPDEVTLMTWPRDGSPGRQQGWLRQPKGYVPTFSGANSRPPFEGYSSVDLRQMENWGVTIEQLDGIPNASGQQLDDAIAELLTVRPDNKFMRGQIATGAYGSTQAELDREQQIRTATTLLSSAPLAPNARRAVFHWLAQQPGATLRHDVRDRIGRRGNAVTFGTSFDQRIPGRRVTVQTILDEAVAAGARGIDADTVVRLLDTSTQPIRKSADRAATINLPAHREQRRWRAELIIDPDTGELLQYSNTANSKSTGPVPELSWHPKSGLQLMVGGGGTSGYGSGGSIYRARDSASRIVPLSPVCTDHPQVCGP